MIKHESDLFLVCKGLIFLIFFFPPFSPGEAVVKLRQEKEGREAGYKRMTLALRVILPEVRKVEGLSYAFPFCAYMCSSDADV